MSWEDCAKDEKGTRYYDGTLEGIRYLVLRGPVSINAYLGIPDNHPMAGMDYDDIDLDVHGGLTFSKIGDGETWPKGYYWFGWDYAHAGGDKSFYQLDYPMMGIDIPGYAEIGWTPEMIFDEVKEAIPKLAWLLRERQLNTNSQE